MLFITIIINAIIIEINAFDEMKVYSYPEYHDYVDGCFKGFYNPIYPIDPSNSYFNYDKGNVYLESMCWLPEDPGDPPSLSQRVFNIRFIDNLEKIEVFSSSKKIGVKITNFSQIINSSSLEINFITEYTMRKIGRLLD